ncbi:MAG TPA: transcriptional regulator [Desulfobulbaceae bacterium]|nr:transcriptional regulator [Desulfobulbaceae bacterium]
MTENNRIEYKRELTDNLEKEVVAFLNYKDGGVIYIGLGNDGKVYGVADCDKVQLAVKDRLKNNIQPSIMGLFDIIHEKREGMDIIRITIAGGLEKPYYLKRYGMTEKGCYLRVGSASEPMSQEMIDALYGRRVRNTIGKMESPRQDLSFEQLKIYYDSHGLNLNHAFMKNLELLTPEGKANYAAYLLADDNSTSLQVAKYADTTRVNLIENRDFGRCSLVKALKGILDRMEIENTIFTKIGYPLREQRELIDSTAMREAVINAVVHNDYSYGATPKFEFFADRMEITSMGGLPYGVDEEDFFSGFSVPRNKEIMRVFRDLEIVEQLGSGVPRILKTYGRNAFEIRKSFVRVVFSYEKPFENTGSIPLHTETRVETRVKTRVETRVETSQLILETLAENPTLTLAQLAKMIDKSISAVERASSKLVKEGRLRHVGPRKGGHWQVLEDQEDEGGRP